MRLAHCIQICDEKQSSLGYGRVQVCRVQSLLHVCAFCVHMDCELDFAVHGRTDSSRIDGAHHSTESLLFQYLRNCARFYARNEAEYARAVDWRVQYGSI